VQHSVNYAIRSGIALTTGYAINAGSRLLKSVKGTEKDEIEDLQARLRSKINIISPPIDMIELIAARGNTTLDSALVLTKQLRMEIQNLGVRLNKAAADEEKIRRKSETAKTSEQMGFELKQIIAQMKRLLARIEDAVPLLMLAITTSGANLSTALPASVSPSRLLQASTFLSAGDANYAAFPERAVQVGPDFVLSVYMLFAAHSLRPNHEEGITDTTWKEVVRKARVKLMRVPVPRLYNFPSDPVAGNDRTNAAYNVPATHKAHEFGYQFLIIEDLDDDRFHEETGEAFEGVSRAGLREIIPIHEVSKIFYADTGKILKIGCEGEPNNPILLIKRDHDAVPPRSMMHDEDDGLDDLVSGARSSKRTSPASVSGHTNGFPPDLDPEWLAFEVYTEAPESDEDDVDEELEADIKSSPPVTTRSRSSDLLSSALSGLTLRGSPAPEPVTQPPAGSPRPGLESSQMAQSIRTDTSTTSHYFPASGLPALRSSLSLLELLIRLTALQQFQQASHLSITDEFLNFFLSGSSSIGAGADSEYRKRVRQDARLRVGFDPYDESPVKQRGEEYIQNNGYSLYEDEEEWAPYDQGARDSPRMSPGLQSPPPNATPSPSLRRHMQQRLGNPGARSRSQQLRQDLGHVRSPLGRSDSDSTLGTSPRTPALDDGRK
jgi:hypothetical protein